MWRYTGKPVLFFILDARACAPLVLAVLWWSWWTLSLAIASTLFFGVLSWFGLTVPALYRLVRRWFAGSRRPAVPTWQRRRLA